MRSTLCAALAFLAGPALGAEPAGVPPVLVCDVRAYGARGDGRHLDTTSIQRAVDACRGKDGVVRLPPGKYLSGTVTLGGRMTFQLDSGATLLGVQAGDEAYPDLHPDTSNGQLKNCRKALLYADGADGLTIAGPGTVDGNGNWKKWGEGVKENERPMALFLVKSANLSIRDLKVRNAAMWAVVLMEATHARVDGLDVDSRSGPTRDGLDIVDGSDVIVTSATVNSEDDAICLKSGLASGLEHVVVRDSRVLGSVVANGLKFGTASVGPLRDVVFENVDVEHVAQAAMAVESVDGSRIDGVTFRNVTFHDVGTAFYVLLGWRGDPSTPRVGSIENLTFSGIRGESSRQRWGSAISGSLVDGTVYAPRGIVFHDVKIVYRADLGIPRGRLPPPPPEYGGQYPDPRLWGQLPASGLFFRHVKDVRMSAIRLTSSPRGDPRPLTYPPVVAAEFDAP